MVQISLLAFILLLVFLLYFEFFRVSACLLNLLSCILVRLRHNKEGRTRLVLTHPNGGCILHDKCSFERGSELEYKTTEVTKRPA